MSAMNLLVTEMKTLFSYINECHRNHMKSNYLLFKFQLSQAHHDYK